MQHKKPRDLNRRLRLIGIYLLVHSHCGLATDAYPTFPVRLLLGKENCTTRQRPFLQNPSSPVQMTIQCLLLKVFDELAGIKRRVEALLNLDASPLIPGLHESVLLPSRRTGIHNAVCMAEDHLHVFGLPRPVSGITLDYAD